MGEQGVNAVAVIDDYLAAISSAHSSLENDAVSRSADGIPLQGGYINPCVECALAVERVEASAERAGHNALHRPERRGIFKVCEACNAEVRGKRLEKSRP